MHVCAYDSFHGWYACFCVRGLQFADVHSGMSSSHWLYYCIANHWCHSVAATTWDQNPPLCQLTLLFRQSWLLCGSRGGMSEHTQPMVKFLRENHVKNYPTQWWIWDGSLAARGHWGCPGVAGKQWGMRCREDRQAKGIHLCTRGISKLPATQSTDTAESYSLPAIWPPAARDNWITVAAKS